MSFKITTETVAKIILWLVFWSLLIMLSAPLMAATTGDTRSSKSISFVNSDGNRQNIKRRAAR